MSVLGLTIGRQGIARLLPVVHVGDLLVLLFLGAADQLDLGDDVPAVFARQEGVDADQRR